jgi:hypothetical protein
MEILHMNNVTLNRLLFEAKQNQDWQQWVYLVAKHDFDKISKGMTLDQKTRLIMAMKEYEKKNAII